MSLLKC